MGKYNIDPAIAKQERDIEVLRAKAMLLGIRVHTTKTMMLAAADARALGMKAFPQHGYDPWIFEHEFLTRVIKRYFELHKM